MDLARFDLGAMVLSVLDGVCLGVFFMFVASSGLYSFNTHYYVCLLIQPASLLHTFLLY